MDATGNDCWGCKKSPGNIRCANCQSAVYCNKECQQSDLIRHKVECQLALSLHACGFCKLKSDDLKRCSGCRTAVYCSKPCQKKHWKVHKNGCEAIQSTVVEQAEFIVRNRVFGHYPDLPSYIGITVARDYINLNKNEGISEVAEIKLLFTGVGDLRDVLKTVVDLPDTFYCNVHFVLNDISPHVMARNILLLYSIMCQPEKGYLVQIWYSTMLTETCMKYLLLMLKTLIDKTPNQLFDDTHGVLEIDSSKWDLVKEIWKEWMRLATTADAKEKMLEMRRIMFQENQNARAGLYSLLQTIPQHHIPSIQAFFDSGILLPASSEQRRQATELNPTLACLNPKNPAYKNYPDIHEEVFSVKAWRNNISPDDRMIYAVRDDTFVFKCWDYVDMVRAGHYHNDINAMYNEFLKATLTKFALRMKSGKIRFRLIIDDFLNLDRHLKPEDRFDRIATSNLCDYYPIPVMFKQFGSHLNRNNLHSVLITRHENWAMLNRMYNNMPFTLTCNHVVSAVADTRARAELLPGIPDYKRLNVAAAFLCCCEDYYDSFSYLFNNIMANILCYLHKYEKQPLAKTCLQHPSQAAMKWGLQFRDFRVELNHVVPYWQEGNIRRVTILHNNIRYVEWFPSGADEKET